MKDRKDGKYAEIINEIAEHIYQDNIKSTERRAKVLFPDGNIRELDLLVTLNNNEQIVFEVRDRVGNQGVDWIDQVIGKYKNTKYSKIWVCTFGQCNLSKAAIKSLKYNNIGWRNIEIMDAKNFSSEPILYINALKIVYDESEMLINGEKYRKLILGCVDGNGNKVSVSLKDLIFNDIKSFISKDFNEFKNKNNMIFQTQLNINNLENNFNSSVLNISISVPLVHYDIFDYFSEKYIISNNNEDGHLLSTENKTIFINDDYLIINFSFLANLREKDYIISNHFILNVKAVPKEYRSKNKIKIIDIDGNSQDVLLKVLGYKEENSFIERK